MKNLELSEPEKCAIHLDLYDTDQTDLMTEFLFSVLITKLYGHGEELFYLPKEIEIKIEIPNGFVNLINKFPILQLFKETKLLLRNLPELKVSQDLYSNVQIVANYLKLLKNNEIDDKDLIFDGKTPTIIASFDTKKKAQTQQQKECQ